MSKRDTSTQKTGNTTKNQASVFKPLIASSLALALGVSVASAAETTVNVGNSDGVNNLTWEDAGSNYRQFAFTSGNRTLESIQLEISGSTLPQSRFRDRQTDGGFDRADLDFASANSQAVLAGGTYGLKIGANGTGTLNASLWNSVAGVDNAKTITLDLSSATSQYALWGNLYVKKTGGEGIGNFVGNFGSGGINGNVTLDMSGTVTGSNPVGLGSATITLKGADANITGNVSVKNNGTYSLTFENSTNSSIGGNLDFSSGSATTTITNLKEIGGDIYIRGGNYTINFENTQGANTSFSSNMRISGGTANINGVLNITGGILFQSGITASLIFNNNVNITGGTFQNNGDIWGNYSLMIGPGYDVGTRANITFAGNTSVIGRGHVRFGSYANILVSTNNASLTFEAYANQGHTKITFGDDINTANKSGTLTFTNGMSATYQDIVIKMGGSGDNILNGGIGSYGNESTPGGESSAEIQMISTKSNTINGMLQVAASAGGAGTLKVTLNGAENKINNRLFANGGVLDLYFGKRDDSYQNAPEGANYTITGQIFAMGGTGVSTKGENKIVFGESTGNATIGVKTMGDVTGTEGTDIIYSGSTYGSLWSNALSANTITFKGSGNNSIYGNIASVADTYSDGLGTPPANTIIFEKGTNLIYGNVYTAAWNSTIGTNNITMSGSANEIHGNIYGAGRNTIKLTATTSNKITGNIYTSSGTNDIAFYDATPSNIITGYVSSTGGTNIITFGATPASSSFVAAPAITSEIQGGVIASGYGTRTNTITAEKGNLSIGALAGQDAGNGYSIYTHNGGGNQNTIRVDNGNLAAAGGIRASFGQNTINAQSLNIGSGGVIAVGDGGNNAAINRLTITQKATINGGISSHNASSKNYISAQTLVVEGNIATINGGSKNVISASGSGSDTSTFGANSAISISAGNGQNIISLGSHTNTLNLSSISVDNTNGRNYIAKSSASGDNVTSGFESNWANTASYQAAGTLTTTDNVQATNGKNYINIATAEIGGRIDANGGSASNNIASDSLTTADILARWGGTNNLISSTTLAISGNINAGESEANNRGNNFVASSGTGATIGKDGASIAVSANNGNNVLSLDGTDNTLILTSVVAINNGKNYIGKSIIDGVSSGGLTLKNIETNSYLSDTQAFVGKLTIANGVSGNNIVSFKASGVSQTASVIAKLEITEESGPVLGTAISGANNIYLNVAASKIGSGVDAIQGYFAALSNQVGADLPTAQKTLLDSSVIAGSIVNSGTTNIKIKGTENTLNSAGADTPSNAEDKAQIGILGNISNNSGTLNIVLEDTFFAPSELIVSATGATPPAQQPATYTNVELGKEYAGNISTASGATTNIITRFTNPVVKTTGISMYNIDANQGSTTNVVIQGNVDLGTHIDYATGSAVNLIFANANNQATDNFEAKDPTLNGNASSSLLGVTYQDGVKLAIADKTVMIGDNPSASFLDTYSSYYTDGSKPLATVWANRTDAKDTVGIEGLVVGDIYSLASSTSATVPGVGGYAVSGKTYDVTLESGSAFAGKIKLDSSTTSAINIVMKENSKLILSDTNDETATDTFVISSLNIEAGSVDQYQLQMETLKQTNNVINLASGGASANNVASRENFRLLAIGNANLSDGTSTAAANTGLYGKGQTVFMTYVNVNANQKDATLGTIASSGKANASRAGVAKDGTYGYVYSDRIIIANIGDNQKAQEGDYYMQFALDAHSKLGGVTYNASNDKNSAGGGGTKTAGNIAVLTVVNTQDKIDANAENKGGINLKTQDVLQGFDRIGGDLIAVETDITGEAGEGKTGYTTYFINNILTRGATEATQEVTASAFATNYDLYLANFNSLNKRMGELRDNANSQGVWARVFSGAQSNDFSKSKSTYTTIQGGYDYALGFEGANNYIGLAVSYSMSSSKSDLNAIDINGSTKGIEDIKSSAVEVAVYNSYVQDEGWYNDTIAKFSYIMSDFTMIGQTSNYSTNNMAFTLSDEFGYRFKLGEAREWYIDPQLEMAFGYFNQSDFVQTLGLSSLEGVAESIYTTRARLGSSFGYDFKKFTENKPIKASVYVGAFYEYDYVVGGDVTLTTNLGGETVSSSAISSDGRVVVNVGTNMTIKDNTRIYFDFETSFAGKITTDYQANVGVRYSFGENTGYTPFDPNKKSITPLKVSDENAEESKETQESVENTQESTQTTTSEQTSEASKESANSKDNKTEESTEVKSEEKAQ